MHLVQEVGQSLHFVNNHPPASGERPQFGRKQARTHQQSLVRLLGQQVEHVRLRQGGP
jgi:hypothetical protein